MDTNDIFDLSSIPLADPNAAGRCLRRIGGGPQKNALLDALWPHLNGALSHAANPDRVLVSLERFLARADVAHADVGDADVAHADVGDADVAHADVGDADVAHADVGDADVAHADVGGADQESGSIEMLRYMADTPRVVEVLITLLAGSRFLTEILLRHPDYLPQLVAHREIAQAKTLDQFCEAAQACTLEGEAADRLDALRRYQRWELLRIGACDLLGLLDLRAVTEQLAHLADSVIRTCLDVAAGQSGTSVDGFAVLAMGKLGGNELNYSSDIDLVFIAQATSTGYFRLGERLIDALTRTTPEGFLYRVDMRLRPWGQSGPLVTSLEGHLKYLAQTARHWEKQALLKARTVAGDTAIGAAFLQQVEPLIFNTLPFNEQAQAIRSDVKGIKDRTESYLRERGRNWGEVKLGEGSIRDVEFVAQYLQLIHGADHPEVRSRNTLDALNKLTSNGLLTIREHRILSSGYTFLRTVEHHLQMLDYRQTYTLPKDRRDLIHLAQRLGFAGPNADQPFLARYDEHRTAIRAVYLYHLGSKPMTTSESLPDTSTSTPNIAHHMARMDPSYVQAFTEAEIARHAQLAEQLDSDHLVEISAEPLQDGRWRVTVIAFDYPGELSLICGLLFVHGFSILDGDVFTYEPQITPLAGRAGRRKVEIGGARRKIVDVFTVRPMRGAEIAAILAGQTWQRYADDLESLLRLTHTGNEQDARGELAKRVAASFQGIERGETTLYPIEIAIDNEISEQYTVMCIDTQDTVGFLYELTNALAVSRIYIARVMVESEGNRVHDTLYVTDAAGDKIVAPEKQRELRAATVLIKHFTRLLPHSPNPESALIHFRQFVGQMFQRPDWPDEFASLENVQVLERLARLLGVSDFLWDDFLRMQHANLFPVVRDADALHTVKSRAQLQAELETALSAVHSGPQLPRLDAAWRQVVNDFKDREMFRIDMRHILGHTQEFGEFSVELTHLAEVVVNSTYHLCHEDLRIVYGSPCLSDGSPSEMTVCALGKCGGWELGFASDIELMFIYAGNGKTMGPQTITTAEFYEKVVQEFVSSIHARREGIFEIDLQLRPYGKSSSMAVSLESFRRYFVSDGPAWAYERQALVKLRPVAGNPDLGQEIVRLRDQFVYTGQPFDANTMRAMRERQIRHLVTGGTFNAKFSPGGLVDVEYLVQGLQITHGHRDPTLRVTNIRKAMAALFTAGILTESDYSQLRRAHTFLRWLIDGLRMVRGNARDLTVPPADSEAFAYLARRLRYGDDIARLQADLEEHTSRVQALGAQLLK
ncbi:MAG: glutamine synthetase adenylyltransferase [Anaerolineae bacterium]|nr:glutamine synthetase adenylyltransferase [Anaerolineae bacterium]